MGRTLYSCLLLAALAGCAGSIDDEGFGGGVDESTADLCNGQAICDRSVDDVTFAGTHNSFSAGFGSVGVWPATIRLENQNTEIIEQLEAGVRAFMLDTWLHEGFAALCHGNEVAGEKFGCSYFGSERNKRLVPELAGMARFLRQHPREVVMLILQNETLSAMGFRDALVAAGISENKVFTYRGSWPTMGELVKNDTRIIVFAEKQLDIDTMVPSWYQRFGQHSFDSPYAARETSELSVSNDYQCYGAGSRGSGSAFYLLNHFISRPTADVTRSKEVNAAAFLRARANNCWDRVGQRPNIIAVDFADQPSWTVVDIAHELNNQKAAQL